ncbi:GNAT family N-acetyltransferase [Roseateles saccharophilus]|uniref:Ribosomal protein S18 acetylase RimI-like enzyme n=1 Tax=Roseateles saccharophilus TaxID=304 RepID=A0A4R3UD64_ROSSA|nr:GNAT family N-acetyltransferase [Roseateles saccharophilus]MDG0835201.1 GNAT family N-acetyltransferase [Roseateles saccharophilus]TCU87133.1 ribosomal protein S18 acetylase RimI-like enzyme [Roseateles saccharophilus]
MTAASALRDLGFADVDALLVLYRHLNAGDAPPPPEAARAVFGHPGLRHFGLFDGEALIASCNLAVIPNLTRGGRSYGVIENVVTHADHRGRGHGQAVIRHAIAQAWAAGAYKVVLTTSRKDPAVWAFYESCGFDSGDKRAFVIRRPAV